MKIPVIYIVLTCLLLLDTFLFLIADISLPGTLPDRVLFWCWLASTFFILVQYRRALWTKVYTILLLVLLFASALPMGAPLVMGLYEREIAMLDPYFEIKGKTYHLEDILSIKEVTNDVRNELVFVFKTGSITRAIP